MAIWLNCLIIKLLKAGKRLLKYHGKLTLNLGIGFIIIAVCNTKNSDKQDTLVSDSNKTSHQSSAIPNSVVSYIYAAIDTMQKYSVRKRYVDWLQLRKETIARAKGVITYRQAYPAIQEALKALGDNHSFLITPEQHQQWLGKVNQSAIKTVVPEGMIWDKKFALLRVYTFSSGDPQQMLSYASGLQAKIKELDAQNPIGWIIN